MHLFQRKQLFTSIIGNCFLFLANYSVCLMVCDHGERNLCVCFKNIFTTFFLLDDEWLLKLFFNTLRDSDMLNSDISFSKCYYYMKLQPMHQNMCILWKWPDVTLLLQQNYNVWNLFLAKITLTFEATGID